MLDTIMPVVYESRPVQSESRYGILADHVLSIRLGCCRPLLLLFWGGLRLRLLGKLSHMLEELVEFLIQDVNPFREGLVVRDGWELGLVSLGS
jgi:hypothetical protein